MPLFGNSNTNNSNNNNNGMMMVPQLPVTMVIIPNELQVHVFEFKVHMNGEERDAIGYKTDGLIRISQQQEEMVFITLKETSKRTKHFVFNDPIRFFQQIYQTKIPVRHGDTTKFFGTKKGIFDSSAILYVTMPQEVGVFQGCLAMILLLTPQEVTALSFMGHMRLLSYMGHQHNFFPYPYWADLQRNPFDLKANIGTLATFDGRCSLPPTSTLTHCQDQNRFILRMQRKDSSFPVGQIPQIDKSIVLLPGCIDESAFGCYVYVPGKNHLNAIIPFTEQARPTNDMACCFVVLVGGHPRNVIRRLEDGVSLFLTEDTWTIFWHYMNKQMHFSLIEEGLSFLLKWV